MKKTTAKEKVSLMAWNLVVEALLGMKEVDSAVLEDLLCKSQVDYDSLSTNAKERLSLRRLEGMFATTINTNSTSHPSISDCAVLDVAEQAQDACPRLSLHKLEEAFIRGGHQSTAFLRGVTGSKNEHQVEVARKLDQIINGITVQTLKASSSHVITQNVDKPLQGSHAKLPNSSRKRERKVRFVNGDKTDGFGPLYEITSPQIPENVIKNMQSVTPDNMMTDKRSVSEFKEIESTSFSNSGDLNATEHNSDSPRICQPFESCRAHISSSIQHEATDLAKRTHLPQRNTNSVDDVGDCEPVISKRIKRSVNVDQMDNLKPPCIHNDDSVAQKEPLDGFLVQDCVNEANNVGDKTESRSRGSGEHPSFAPSLHFNLETTIAAKRSGLLSSEMTLTEDSLDADWTEKESCITCNRGQQLLKCRSNTCQIAVHESCLGFSPVLDNSGDFYCPSCSYSKAVTVYNEIKKNMIQAKEMVELAKDRMHKFMNLGYLRKQKQPAELPSMEESGQSRMVGNVNLLDEVSAKGKHEDIDDIAFPTGETQKRQAKKHFGGSVLEYQEDLEPSPELPSMDDHQHIDVGQPQRVSSEVPPSPVSDGNDNAATVSADGQREVGDSPGRSSVQSDKNVEEDLEPSPELPSMGDHQHIDVGQPQRASSEVPPSPVSDGNDNAATVNADGQREVGDSPGRSSVQSDKNVEEVSKYDNDSEPRNLRRRQMLAKGSNPKLHVRRKKISWTPKEEEKLKEGVQKYANYEGPIPWKTILESGQGIFQESRTAIDLKDKWRNMCSRGGRKAR